MPAGIAALFGTESQAEVFTAYNTKVKNKWHNNKSMSYNISIKLSIKSTV